MDPRGGAAHAQAAKTAALLKKHADDMESWKEASIQKFKLLRCNTYCPLASVDVEYVYI